MARAEKNVYILRNKLRKGIIYDRNFNKIVANEQIFNLVLKEETSNEALSEVAKILNLESIEEGNTCIKENLSNQEVIVLKTKLDKLQGFELEKKNIRNYENGYAFSHIIGFLSKDEEKGQDGIEKEYEDILKEIPGITKYKRDALNNILGEELVKDPESGKSLILNIDKNLQIKSAEVLKSVANETNATGGSIIIMNPKTGEVLTLVNYPSYDNNFFSKNFNNEAYQALLNSKDISFFNRGISGAILLHPLSNPFLHQLS